MFTGRVVLLSLNADVLQAMLYFMVKHMHINTTESAIMKWGRDKNKKIR